jgi:hypothetical protein
MEADHVDSLARLQAGRPCLRDSPEKDRPCHGQSGRIGRRRATGGEVIGMLRKLSRKARGVAALGQRQVFVSRHPLYQDACLDPPYR